MEKLGIDGAALFTPTIHDDRRGAFLEWFRADDLAGVGHRMSLAQANCSISRKGVVRGIHFADVPPGQAKYVTCVAGAVWDVVVDVRVGSPTFGRWEAVRLDDVDRKALYVAEGLGHGFVALTDSATVVYLCSTPYAPERERTIHALDPDLAIEWPIEGEPVMSPRDADAPSLGDARAAGALPAYETCLEMYSPLA